MGFFERGFWSIESRPIRISRIWGGVLACTNCQSRRSSATRLPCLIDHSHALELQRIPALKVDQREPKGCVWIKGALNLPIFGIPSFGFPIFWSRRYAERIWGEFFILVRRILGKLPAIFSANFDGEFFGLVFPGFRGTQKIHAQNSRPELSAFLSNFTFSNPNLFTAIFCFRGRPTFFSFFGIPV